MAPEYRIDVKNTAGSLQAVLTDFLYLGYRKAVNEPGALSFGLGGDHPLLSTIADKWQVEVWRRDPARGIAWYADFYGLFRDDVREMDDNGYESVELTCPGQSSMLGWRHNLYLPETPNRTLFSTLPAETVMKTIVQYNFTASATTANGRQRDGQLTGISIQADGGDGNTISWQSARSNVLSELQKIASIGGGDFDLIKTGGATWEFRFYQGQRGVDRSASVVFATEYGNMRAPRLSRPRSSEYPVAIVGGKGQEEERRIRVRTGPNYHATNNNIERWIDQTSLSDPASLDAAGDAALEASRAVATLEYKVMQTPASLYGLHYCVAGDIGDLITARYRGIELTQKIRAVTVEFRNKRQAIDIEAEDE